MGLRRNTIEDAIKVIQERLDQASVGKPTDLSLEEQEKLVAELKDLLQKRRKGWRMYVG